MVASVKRPKKGEVIYLYGLTAADSANATIAAKVTGVAAVEVISCGEFASWISWVPQAEFADNLATNMENLDWLSTMSIAHQRAVATIAKSQDILPARLGTVFLNEDSLCTSVERRKKVLSQDFRRIQGAEEWGIKVFALKHTKKSVGPRPKTGRAYLQAKSALIAKREPPGRSEEIQEFAKSLMDLSEAQAAGGKISAGQRDLKFQISLLIKRVSQKKFESIVNRYSKKWAGNLKIEATGPWPPYSFISPKTE